MLADKTIDKSRANQTLGRVMASIDIMTFEEIIIVVALWEVVSGIGTKVSFVIRKMHPACDDVLLTRLHDCAHMGMRPFCRPN